MNIRETAPRMTELEKISTRTDTRDYLAKAAATTEKLKDWLVVDVDAHVNETAFWSEVTDRIDNEVLRYIAEAFRDRGPAPGLLNPNGPLYQDVAGRIMHQQKLAEARCFRTTPPPPQAGLAQFLHAPLRGAGGGGQAARLPRRLHLGRSVVRAAQPLHRHALVVVRALQYGPPDQLGAQRPARAL